jgi:hypothetical protein
MGTSTTQNQVPATPQIGNPEHQFRIADLPKRKPD